MWKTKLGRCIYTSPSGYKVYQNLIYRWLTMGSDALQTVINRRKPEQPILYYLPALTLMVRHYPERTCLLGLGGAGVALMLADTPLVAVDNSKEVIDIAQRFFMTDKLEHLTVIHDDAMHYIQNKENLYPHLLVDLYNANHFPPECADDEFFISCKQIITEEGFLAINFANLKEQWPLFQLVKKHFNHTLVIPIKQCANMVIIASKCESKELFIRRIEESGELKRVIWVEEWGYVADY